MRRDLGDPNPGAYPVTLFLSRPEGLGARGAAAEPEAAFRRLSIEERDEVVAALVAEFKAGERKRLRCWDAGRGSVCGVPFPGWEDWVREGRVLLFEGGLEEVRSGPPAPRMRGVSYPAPRRGFSGWRAGWRLAPRPAHRGAPADRRGTIMWCQLADQRVG